MAIVGPPHDNRPPRRDNPNSTPDFRRALTAQHPKAAPTITRPALCPPSGTARDIRVTASPSSPKPQPIKIFFFITFQNRAQLELLPPAFPAPGNRSDISSPRASPPAPRDPPQTETLALLLATQHPIPQNPPADSPSPHPPSIFPRPPPAAMEIPNCCPPITTRNSPPCSRRTCPARLQLLRLPDDRILLRQIRARMWA